MRRLLLTSLALASAALAAQPPNLLIILADDLGWRDAGFAGNNEIDTPQLDALAKRGTVFTEACASAPNCAPTRACLLTGRYPPRHGIYTVVDERHMPGSPWQKVLAAESRPELATEKITLAEILRDHGYVTGMVGMWNLGRGRRGPTTPEGQGFGFCKQPKDIGFDNDRYRDGEGRDLTDVMAEECVSFIRSNKEWPWFLYFAPHAVHAPYEPKPELVEKYRRRDVENPEYAATVESLDTAVGSVLGAIEELDLRKNTLVVFSSDNGGDREFTPPLRGYKGMLYQGGLRVPMAVAGPGVRAGASCSVPVLSMDLFPTLIDFAGAEPPDCDGGSLRPLLTGRGGFPERDLFWHFPCYTGGGTPASAMRSGKWKLIEFFESRTTELYDLSSDPLEKNNLAATESRQTQALLTKLHTWQASTGAFMANRPNPAYDPSIAPKRGRGERRNPNLKPHKP